jgi:hypothetical protein
MGCARCGNLLGAFKSPIMVLKAFWRWDAGNSDGFEHSLKYGVDELFHHVPGVGYVGEGVPGHRAELGRHSPIFLQFFYLFSIFFLNRF